jgi:2-keto-3-deoxy-L-rhamnonate aldolase RhmA
MLPGHIAALLDAGQALCAEFWKGSHIMNKVKDVLKAGKVAVGTSAGPDVSTAALLADGGFDFLLFDTQHSPVMPKELGPAIAGMKGRQASPVVRVGDNRADLIVNAMDAGARGIIVPMVNSREEAERVVRAVKYYPDGDRSNAGQRGDWGREFPAYRDYLDAANAEMLIVVMIETNTSLSNLDQICSVPGIDVLLIGPSDFSIELDVPLDYTSGKYQDALGQVVAGAQRHGVAPGMYFIPPGLDENHYVDMGFKFFTVPWQPMATAGMENALTAIKR